MPWVNWSRERAWSVSMGGKCLPGRTSAPGLASEGDLTKPASLDRVCGKDTTGTLYIGHAKSLHSRLNQLRRSSSGHQSSHNAGRPMNRTLRARFPSNKLAVAILSTGATTFRMIERDLIQAYMNSFGDTPPLNYSLRA